MYERKIWGRFFIEKYLNYSRRLFLVEFPHPWGRLSPGLCSTQVQSSWLAVAVLPLGKADDMCISLSFLYQAVNFYCLCLFIHHNEWFTSELFRPVERLSEVAASRAVCSFTWFSVRFKLHSVHETFIPHFCFSRTGPSVNWTRSK